MKKLKYAPASVKNKMPDAFLAEIELLESDEEETSKLIESEPKDSQ